MLKVPDPAFVVTVIMLLGMIPFLAVLTTSFTKLVIVFGLLRMALGIQQIPPNIVINALALILSAFIMAPVGQQAFDEIAKKQTSAEFGQKFEDLRTMASAAAPPLKDFLMRQTGEREKRLFLKAANDLWPKEQAEKANENDLLILIPSFTLSELTEAFKIGFFLYVVFTVIDLLVSAVLLALGMSMVSPMTVSIPFKLLLFVVLDGWSTLIMGLLQTYRH
jgi:type III secretion protein R